MRVSNTSRSTWLAIGAAAATFSVALLGSASAAPRTRPASGHSAVFGGTPAAAGTLPSLAFILDVKGTVADQCTGTVVAPNLVLTAAHCAASVITGVVDQPAQFQVVTGAVEWQAATRQQTTVSRVIIYPGYARRIDDGDAALLVLATPTTAPAIALATPSSAHWVHAGTPATIAGWGKTHYPQRGATKRLMQAPTGVQSSGWCVRHSQLFDPVGEICAVDPPHYRTGGCEGDSGGPLIAVDPSSGEPVEIGVTIRAEYNCSTTAPTVFTRVSRFSRWAHRWITTLKPPPPAGPVTTTTTTSAAPVTP
jgi:secreted trypsin-like serine protease